MSGAAAGRVLDCRGFENSASRNHHFPTTMRDEFPDGPRNLTVGCGRATLNLSYFDVIVGGDDAGKPEIRTREKT